MVHFDGDRVDAIGLEKPALTLLQLGGAEAKRPSRFYDYVQWIQASRGRTAFVDKWSNAIAFLYLFTPMTVEKYLDTWIAHIEVHEFPAR